MASVYKRKRDLERALARQENASSVPWYIHYTDHLGNRVTAVGFPDKRETERLAARLEHEAMLRRRGLIDPEQEEVQEKKRSPLRDHLKIFEKSLSDNTPKHVKLVLGRVRRIVEGCQFETAAQIDPEKVENFLRELATKKQLKNRTYNHYLQALDEFCQWMVRTRRMAVNPLIGLGRRNADVDMRRRRALSVEELSKLLQSARNSGITIQCFDGETRARIYLLSFLTGLRRTEIASLTPSSFNLDNKHPTVTVEASVSKHRRRDVLPLHPQLVVMLRKWIRGIAPEQVLFPKLAKRRTWRMVKLDLERVGISYKTAEGVADFHAAGRHTYITELLRNGATLPEAKELARHSDVKMTMRYTHVGMEDRARALSGLPVPKVSTQPPKSPEPTGQPNGSQSRGQRCPVMTSRGLSERRRSPGRKTRNPRRSEGYDASCHQVTPSGTEGASVEAAGIEPASRNSSTPASTCVVELFNLAAEHPCRPGCLTASPELF